MPRHALRLPFINTLLHMVSFLTSEITFVDAAGSNVQGVSESSMFSHFPQCLVGVNRSLHVGSSNRQPSLGDKGHYFEPHGRSMSLDYRFESDVNLCEQNTRFQLWKAMMSLNRLHEYETIRVLAGNLLWSQPMKNMDLYIPKKCSAINGLITSKDHASILINFVHWLRVHAHSTVLYFYSL
ncbi:40S ribosomal protein S21-like protein [Tanacetum coccineum]